MDFKVILSIVIAIIALIYLWIRKKYSYFRDHGFLYKEPIFPFGSMKGIGTVYHPADIFRNVYEEFRGKAPVCGLYMFLQPAVMILDLDVLKDVMITSFDKFRNRGVFNNVRDDPLTGHLFTLEDQPWRNMRMKLTPTFTSGKMKMMFNIVLEVSDHMLESLGKNSDLAMIEVKEMLSQFTTDVIGNVAFGLEMNAINDPNCEFRRISKKLFSENFFGKVLFLTTYRDLARKLRMKLLSTEISDFFLKNIRQTIDYRLENNVERNDFLNLLLKMYAGKSEDGSTLTFEELAAQAFIFFNAGFETSSSTMTFVLYNLALNPDIQEKLRDEVRSVIARHDGKITYDGMMEIKYLNMVIEETLRMYGPVPQLIRIASEDYQVPNTKLTIEKDSLIFIPIYGIHNDPKYFPEPEQFDPERFSDENKAKRHHMAFIPFGDGPRNCIGLRFGLMQAKIGMIQLLLNYKFLPNAKTAIPMKLDPKIPFLLPPGGMWLKFEKLQD